MRFVKFSYFRQSVDNKMLAPDVFEYEDSKSKSWHRAKKFEKYLWTTNPSFAVIKNRVFIHRRFSTIIKIN